MSERTIYDSSDAYNSDVLPLVKQLLDLCDKHGVQLFGTTTYAIVEVPCHCGRPQCDGTGYGFKADTFGVCDPDKMTNLQAGIMLLAQLPSAIQNQLIEAIKLAARAVDSGGQVNIERVDLAGDDPFQSEVRRLRSALKRRGGWSNN